jgi:hypothetical protein
VAHICWCIPAPPRRILTPQAADEGAVEAAPTAADPDPEALGVAAADASAEAAAPPVAPSGYNGERNLGRDFYNKRFRLLLNHVVESGPPLTEPALLHDQEVCVGARVWVYSEVLLWE